MSTELVLTTSKFRHRIPEAHRATLDTRIQWLWNQRWGTVQTIWQKSPDLLDHTAAELFLQAVMGKDIESIAQVFQRLEGGAISDEALADQDDETLRV